MESELVPKTSSELKQLIAELSSLSPKVFRLHKIGDAGNFTATMIAGTGVRFAIASRPSRTQSGSKVSPGTGGNRKRPPQRISSRIAG